MFSPECRDYLKSRKPSQREREIVKLEKQADNKHNNTETKASMRFPVRLRPSTKVSKRCDCGWKASKKNWTDYWSFRNDRIEKPTRMPVLRWYA